MAARKFSWCQLKDKVPLLIAKGSYRHRFKDRNFELQKFSGISEVFQWKFCIWQLANHSSDGLLREIFYSFIYFLIQEVHTRTLSFFNQTVSTFKIIIQANLLKVKKSTEMVKMVSATLHSHYFLNLCLCKLFWSTMTHKESVSKIFSFRK